MNKYRKRYFKRNNLQKNTLNGKSAEEWFKELESNDKLNHWLALLTSICQIDGEIPLESVLWVKVIGSLRWVKVRDVLFEIVNEGKVGGCGIYKLRKQIPKYAQWCISKTPEAIIEETNGRVLIEEMVKEFRADASARFNERMRTDEVFAYRTRMRRRLQNLDWNKEERGGWGTDDCIGCTWKDFKEHIEKQFTLGMSHENRDLWHLDHIIPISLATKSEDIRTLSHYSNIRPLWADLNVSKGDDIIPLDEFMEGFSEGILEFIKVHDLGSKCSPEQNP